jgi:endoglucanase
MRTPHFPGRRAGRALAVIPAAMMSLSLMTGCGTGPDGTVQAGSVAAAAKVRDFPHKIYAYPDRRLAAAVAVLKADRQAAEAAELAALGTIPSSIWAAGQPGEMRSVKRITLAAGKDDAAPVIVAYNLPDRDVCGKYSAAPGPSARGYLTWINQLAAAVGTGHDIVIVEPDGLADLLLRCLSPAQATVRYRLLRYAMRRLGGLPHTQVYLDAGNPGMFPNPARLAGPLARAGLRYGRGFSANVSNFEWTQVMVGWSQRLERALGGSIGAVIDTSRNGNGPYTGGESPQWCNPPGRAPGPAPQLYPGPAGIDAYLWIKNPGVSDGPCNGGPAAGQFWTQYAVGLARSRHP